ncbi:MAG: RimK family alpha-L-glutamate ligase [Planctomycetota bacterium]
MRIALLSRDDRLYASRRLLEAGRARGHEVHLVSTLEGRVVVGGAPAQVSGAEEPWGGCHALIPRVGSFLPRLGIALVRDFEERGGFSLNPAGAIIRSRDKLGALQRLDAAGLPVPRSVFAKDLTQIEDAINAAGGAPVVIKPLEGSQGRGVMRADTVAGALSIVEALIYRNLDVFLQEYVSSSSPSDLRLLVLGSQVRATVRRRARPGEFRANLHRGGSMEAITPRADMVEIAIEAARALGLRLAGVDILESERGPLVLEVNSSPGLEGIERATGVDLAAAIIEFLESSPEARRRPAPADARGATSERSKSREKAP